MKVLLLAATPHEIQPFLNYYKVKEGVFQINQHNVRVLISGVGMVATAFSLGKELTQNSFDLAINAGIAGSFTPEVALGEVVRVQADCLAELGAEDGEDFLTLNQLGFGESTFSSISTNLPASIARLKAVSAITVNRVHGSERSIQQVLVRLNPQIETMEGAAFYYACNQTGLSCVQIRAISNKVERRNKENWNIPLAIKNLNDCLINIFNTI